MAASEFMNIISLFSNKKENKTGLLLLCFLLFKYTFYERLIQNDFFPIGFKERKYIKLSPSTLNLPGINSLLLQGSLLWNNLLREIKESLLTEEF